MKKLDLHRKKLMKLKLDKGIRELVVLLNYFTIETEMSCWGHKDKGFGYPWIDSIISSKFKIDNLLSNSESLNYEIETKELNIEEIDIKTKEIFIYNAIRISPRYKRLLKGRKQFNRFKSYLKKKLKYELL